MTPNKKKILVAEDSRLVAQMLKDDLTSFGYEIHHVSDGSAALEFVQDPLKLKSIDLFLLDLEMPGASGIEVCKAIRKQTQGQYVPVILLTSESSVEKVKIGFESGVNDYIYKPYRKEELKCRIASFLELKEMHENLRKLNEKKGQFLGMCSHDLKNPINIIMVSLSNLKMFSENKFSKQEAQCVDICVRATERMLALINDLLDVEQIEREKMVLSHAPISFKNLIQKCVEETKILAEKKEIKFVVQLENDLEVVCDPQKIEQVVINFLSNAIKYTKRKGQVHVSFSPLEIEKTPFLWFSVMDTGIGIPEKELPQAFREFQKLSSRPTEGESSTGLGLSICKKIIEAHGGEVWVESKVGVGSTFSFRIPLKKELKIAA